MKKRLSIGAACLAVVCVFYAAAKIKQVPYLTAKSALIKKVQDKDNVDLQIFFNEWQAAADARGTSKAELDQMYGWIAGAFGSQNLAELKAQYIKDAEAPEVRKPGVDDANILASIDQLAKDMAQYKAGNPLGLELADLKEVLESAQNFPPIKDAARRQSLAGSIAFLQAEIAKLEVGSVGKPSAEAQNAIAGGDGSKMSEIAMSYFPKIDAASQDDLKQYQIDLQAMIDSGKAGLGEANIQLVLDAVNAKL